MSETQSDRLCFINHANLSLNVFLCTFAVKNPSRISCVGKSDGTCGTISSSSNANTSDGDQNLFLPMNSFKKVSWRDTIHVRNPTRRIIQHTPPTWPTLAGGLPESTCATKPPPRRDESPRSTRERGTRTRRAIETQVDKYSGTTVKEFVIGILVTGYPYHGFVQPDSKLKRSIELYGGNTCSKDTFRKIAGKLMMKCFNGIF